MEEGKKGVISSSSIQAKKNTQKPLDKTCHKKLHMPMVCMCLAVFTAAAMARGGGPDTNLDTLPVSYYGAAFTRNEANIDMLSKMRVIVLMQQDGHCWLKCCPFMDNATYTAACQPSTMVPLPNAASFAGCDAGCDQAGTQLDVFDRVGAAAAAGNRVVPQRVLYMNAVYNWPFYRMNAAGVANISVLDIHGNVHAEESVPGQPTTPASPPPPPITSTNTSTNTKYVCDQMGKG
jgi:hypothetical protein